jgi:hypothetical protein
VGDLRSGLIYEQDGVGLGGAGEFGFVQFGKDGRRAADSRWSGLRHGSRVGGGVGLSHGSGLSHEEGLGGGGLLGGTWLLSNRRRGYRWIDSG